MGVVNLIWYIARLSATQNISFVAVSLNQLTIVAAAAAITRLSWGAWELSIADFLISVLYDSMSLLMFVSSFLWNASLIALLLARSGNDWTQQLRWITERNQIKVRSIVGNFLALLKYLKINPIKEAKYPSNRLSPPPSNFQHACMYPVIQ